MEELFGWMNEDFSLEEAFESHERLYNAHEAEDWDAVFSEWRVAVSKAAADPEMEGNTMGGYSMTRNALKQKMLEAQMQEHLQAQQQAKALRELSAKFMMPATAATPQGADTPAGNSMGNPNLFSTSPSNAVTPGKEAQPATPAYFDREGFGK